MLNSLEKLCIDDSALNFCDKNITKMIRNVYMEVFVSRFCTNFVRKQSFIFLVFCALTAIMNICISIGCFIVAFKDLQLFCV